MTWRTMGRLDMALEMLAVPTGTSFTNHAFCSLAHVQRLSFFQVRMLLTKDLQWNSTPLGGFDEPL